MGIYAEKKVFTPAQLQQLCFHVPDVPLEQHFLMNYYSNQMHRKLKIYPSLINYYPTKKS